MPIKIKIPQQEFFNEETNEFITVDGTTLTLEHSLVSISKWESKWHKHFLNNKDKTEEEIFDYLRCMTITQNVNPEIYKYIPIDEIEKVKTYIEDPMTATRIKHNEKSGRGKILTAEVIYFYMFSYNIPIDLEKWHLNRLLTLIDVFNEENKPKKKKSPQQTISEYAALNAARRARFNSAG